MKKLSIVLFAGILIYTFVTFAFRPQCAPVAGISMFPNIQHNDVCLIHGKWLFDDIQIDIDDIVVFNYKGKSLIKRVVAKPGDAVVIADGVLLVNGQMENTNYLLISETFGSISLILKENEYFVLGDNRVYSKDSRSFGPVNRNQIIGKVFARWRSLIEI